MKRCLIAVLTLVLASATSCASNKDNPTPPASAAPGTMGWTVDGSSFTSTPVATDSTGNRYGTYAVYKTELQKLYIYGIVLAPYRSVAITAEIGMPGTLEIGGGANLATLQWSDSLAVHVYHSDSVHTGSLIISKLDITSTKLVSGTFRGSLVQAKPDSNGAVTITNGSFTDVPIEVRP